MSLTRELTLNSTVGRKERKDTHDFIIPKKKNKKKKKKKKEEKKKKKKKKKDGRSDKF